MAYNMLAAERPIELAAGSLFLLGDVVLIDDRLSWRAPEQFGKFESLNAYLLKDGDDSLMVDTGVALHGQTILAQLHSLRNPPAKDLRVACTRNEPDCISNTSILVRGAGLKLVFAPGILNFVDFFQDISSSLLLSSFGVGHHPLAANDKVAVGEKLVLEAIATPLRMFTSLWYYEPTLRTLFCSDAFSDAAAQGPERRVVSEKVDIEVLVKQMKRHLLMRYDWMVRGDLSSIVRGLREILDARRVDVLAPSRGCVIMGTEAVEQRIEGLMRALETIRD
jgi:glyoxylase-like metal-dependent hydrolase (beta-lactamase superfamily II)